MIDNGYKIIKAAEDCGFNLVKTDSGYEVSKTTPAGEDWFFNVNNLDEIKDYAENFDPEYEFNVLYEANIKGTPGVGALWKDQLWKQKQLRKLVKGIEND